MTNGTETAGEALYRFHWDRLVEPYRQAQGGDAHAPGRPEWGHLHGSVRARWDQAAADFSAWLREHEDGGEDGGDGEPSGS